MASRPLFKSKRREALWLTQCLIAYRAGRSDGSFCLCNLCDTPVYKTDAWDESHAPERPKAFGGRSTGIGHRRCNREHGAQVVTPAVAKSDRIRRRAIGALTAGLGQHAMPGGSRSALKRTVAGRVVARTTLREKHAAFLAKRGILYQVNHDRR